MFADGAEIDFHTCETAGAAAKKKTIFFEDFHFKWS